MSKSANIPISKPAFVYPGSSTDNAIAKFDSTTGRVIQNSTTLLQDDGGIVLPSTSGVGIKVDTANPAYGWRDLEGMEIPDLAGGDAPALAVYRTGIRELAYTNLDKLDIRFHMPHDYAPGTDMYIHVHWSHIGTAISGNIVFDCTYSYAKGHNQENFTAPKTLQITYATTNIATTPQYRHRIEETQLSIAGGSVSLLDSSTLEVDGLILMGVVLTTNPTITGGTTNVAFIHRVDIHYQSTNMNTKNKAPNFYT